MANTKIEKLSILRRKQVEDRTGLSRSTIYLYIQEGAFPKPINLGARAVGWVESEVEKWLTDRIEVRDRQEHC
jgi:prophage regulatory protein